MKKLEISPRPNPWTAALATVEKRDIVENSGRKEDRDHIPQMAHMDISYIVRAILVVLTETPYLASGVDLW